MNLLHTCKLCDNGFQFYIEDPPFTVYGVKLQDNVNKPSFEWKIKPEVYIHKHCLDLEWSSYDKLVYRSLWDNPKCGFCSVELSKQPRVCISKYNNTITYAANKVFFCLECFESLSGKNLFFKR